MKTYFMTTGCIHKVKEVTLTGVTASTLFHFNRSLLFQF